MTTAGRQGPERLRLLASYLAGRPVDVSLAPSGQPAHTDGAVVFVSSDGSPADQRREVLVQSALLGAGSLDPRLIRAMRARPSVARRYLALEGRRVLAALADRMPLAATLANETPGTTSADESLEIARGRRLVADAPEWFGVIRPGLLLKAPPPAPGREAPLRFDVPDIAAADDDGDDDDDDEQAEESKILKLFESPLSASQVFGDFLGKLLGRSRAPGDDGAGGELPIRSARRARHPGPHARPLPTRIRFTGGTPGAALGVGGALHPEWDVHHRRYRPDWCRVVQFPLTAGGAEPVDVPRDDVLRRRLSRVGLGVKALRGRPDGDELDLEALVDLFVDLRSGWSPPEHVYTERRKVQRDLGVLILVDASGSVTDSDAAGLAVHDHQCRAAAMLAATFEELGDRVAVYAFRSHGRHAVHLAAVTTFGQRFGAAARARLAHLRPSGYTRLGAGIRGAGEILRTGAGTPNRLLIVLSDGFPYDDGYEGRYAEADANRALEELRADGIACLCLSIGAPPAADTLERVFGAAGHACAPTLAELSPRMDELFLSALRELAVASPGKISST